MTNEPRALFLWELRWLARFAPKQPKKKFDIKYKESDCYILCAQELIRRKIIKKADFMHFDVRVIPGRYKVDENISILAFNDIGQAIRHIGKQYHFLFIRGNYKEWNELLPKIKSHVRLFYAADTKFMPRYFNNLDIIYVDEPKYLGEVRRKFPRSQAVVLEKTTNPKIFFADKAGKKFDVCYPSNFMQWKGHELLFSALEKIPGSQRMRFICIGDTWGQDEKIGVWMRKFNINVHLPGRLHPREMAKILRKSKVGVIPNEKDANPRTITEMLASGLPIVANKYLSGGLHNISRTKKTGMVAVPEPKKFSQALHYMILNHGKFSPQKYFKKNLSPEVVTERCFIKPLKKII